MRTRKTLLARAARDEIVEALSTNAGNEETPARRLLWAQVCCFGDGETWPPEQDEHSETAPLELFEYVPGGALDYVFENDLYLRWKADHRARMEECHGSRIHDGAFSIL